MKHQSQVASPFVSVFRRFCRPFHSGRPRAILWRMSVHDLYRRATRCGVLSPLVLSLILGGTVCTGAGYADQALVRALAESNVNQQYLVESVSISGVEVARFHDSKLSPSLRRRIAALVGAPCDMLAIGDLAGRLRSTLHLQDVKQRLSRGSSPDRVRVNFEVVQKDYAFDLSVPRFLYDSSQGWTAELDASARFREHSINVALGSNGDELTERFTGFSTRYENSHVFSDRVRFGIGIEGYHDLWNPSTRVAVAGLSGQAAAQNDLNASASGTSNEFALYRTRRNIAPALTFVLNRDLSVSVGASFERMEMEAPSNAGNDMSNSANAATAEVDFGRTVEGGENLQRWDGKYGVRVGTRQLGSDYVYVRHSVSVRYEWRSGRHLVADRLIAGAISGQAPLFERFVLGNSSTLQGWDHYTIDPRGGNRMVHNSVSYGHQFQEGTPEVFYDAGIVGNGNTGNGNTGNSNPGNGNRLGTLRHSLGVGFRQGIFNVAMAFPLCQGRFAAVFMAGMNY